MDAAVEDKNDIDDFAYTLLGSFSMFTRFFHKKLTNKKFLIPEPPGRQSHVIEIAKALTKVQHGDITRLIINIPPRYGKTCLIINYIAWSLARNPACEFIFVSYGHSLAAKQTTIIRQILNLPDYRRLFPWVEITADTNAKDNFRTTAGGEVYAVGRAGSITGRGAGKRNSDVFAGAIIIDDIIKPDEATSDTVRASANDFYYSTLLSRLNDGPKTPIIFIGQRLHEDDLAGKLISEDDNNEWHKLIMPAIDSAGNALNPDYQTVEDLRKDEKKQPYVFASQYQQDPVSAGNTIFKPDWFRLTDIPENITDTFLTVDAAETDKTYNDATVFSFWGVYKHVEDGVESGELCLHWIDSVEIRVEPKDLKREFMIFMSECRRFHVKPKHVYIETKSAGTTLNSLLDETVGIINIPVTRDRTSKTERFLRSQPFAASGQISVTQNSKHTSLVIDHMKKITANNTHRHDDICDTFADAVQIALIDKTFAKPERPRVEINYQPISSGLAQARY